MADTPRTQSALLTTLFQDGQAANSITAQDMRDLIVSLQMRGGWADYNDATTAGTPISMTSAGGYVGLTNDNAGANSASNWINPAISGVWNTGTNRFDWTDLAVGDAVAIRLDLAVTTTGANQTVEVALEMASGHASTFDIPYTYGLYKSAGTYSINRWNEIYMGSSDILNNPARFKIKSDGNASVVVNGWYCRVIKV